jgi:hypothetical protein
MSQYTIAIVRNGTTSTDVSNTRAIVSAEGRKICIRHRSAAAPDAAPRAVSLTLARHKRRRRGLVPGADSPAGMNIEPARPLQ